MVYVYTALAKNTKMHCVQFCVLAKCKVPGVFELGSAKPRKSAEKPLVKNGYQYQKGNFGDAIGTGPST
jgi:hypothetical protein